MDHIRKRFAAYFKARDDKTINEKLSEGHDLYRRLSSIQNNFVPNPVPSYWAPGVEEYRNKVIKSRLNETTKNGVINMAYVDAVYYIILFADMNANLSLIRYFRDALEEHNIGHEFTITSRGEVFVQDKQIGFDRMELYEIIREINDHFPSAHDGFTVNLDYLEKLVMHSCAYGHQEMMWTKYGRVDSAGHPIEPLDYYVRMLNARRAIRQSC